MKGSVPSYSPPLPRASASRPPPSSDRGQLIRHSCHPVNCLPVRLRGRYAWKMKARLLFLSCVLIAWCNKPSIAENPRNENTAPKADAKSPATPASQAAPDEKPSDVQFDLLRDTARVREALAGVWYQVDHMRDGSSSSLATA